MTHPFPLNRTWRLRDEVVDDAVDAADFGHDSGYPFSSGLHRSGT
jgi:hypothetical protein